jgi:hypothetical protein
MVQITAAKVFKRPWIFSKRFYEENIWDFFYFLFELLIIIVLLWP